jgi:hypothetical protein
MVFDLIESAKPGDRILISFDYDPGSKPELQPAAVAIMRHAIEKELRIVCTALWAMGVGLLEEIYEAESDYLIYGENFINLGFAVGGLVAIQSMGRDFISVFPRDAYGNNVNDFNIMRGVRNLDDFEIIVSIYAGTPGIIDWIMVAGDNFGRPITGATTAVSTPSILPYINEQRQLIGLIGGLKSAAEYEKLIGVLGTATDGMDAQSIAHLIIIIFIVLGNLSYHLNKKKPKQGG